MKLSIHQAIGHPSSKMLVLPIYSGALQGSGIFPLEGQVQSIPYDRIQGALKIRTKAASLLLWSCISIPVLLNIQ